MHDWTSYAVLSTEALCEAGLDIVDTQSLVVVDMRSLVQTELTWARMWARFLVCKYFCLTVWVVVVLLRPKIFAREKLFMMLISTERFFGVKVACNWLGGDLTRDRVEHIYGLFSGHRYYLQLNWTYHCLFLGSCFIEIFRTCALSHWPTFKVRRMRQKW